MNMAKIEYQNEIFHSHVLTYNPYNWSKATLRV